jgi:uncharacterized protein YqjF (DUF2071 family)
MSLLSIKEILESVAHRPWPLPNSSWKYYQEWNNALFLHWEVEPDLLHSFLPAELELDLIEDNAWVSLVIFDMERIRPRNLPAVSLISDFHEINLRTYVKHRNKTGVYFLSIEAGKRLSSSLAKAISELPYRYSQMMRERGYTLSHNAQRGDIIEVRYNVGEVVQIKTSVDTWLTERYALFQDGKRGLNAFDIHHVEWPIHEVKLQQLKCDYPMHNDLLQGEPNLVHYSPGVQVLAWGKERG